MKKRLTALILSVVLVTGLIPTALAVAPSQDQAARALAALDVMVGDEDGNLMLDRSVTRAEFTKMIISMSVYKDSVGDETLASPYPDVPYAHWAAPYVEAAVQAGYVTGYLDGTFRPGKTISLAEGVTMALRILGYEDSDFIGVYPAGQMALYRTLNLDEGLSASANTDTLTRRDAMYLLYNLLTAKNKTGAVYIAALGYSLTSSGEVDLVALVNDAMEGPLVAGSDWRSEIPFSLSNAAFYRSGALSSASEIQTGDVLYWSASMRTVWAYTDRVTGTYQSASPSSSAPASVTVAGRSYAIETASAAFDLSDLGGFSTGDTVTLLLGRNGGVAAVMTAVQSSSSILYGAVTSVGADSYTDAAGNTYTASAVTFTATDGGQYTYQTSSKTFSAGDLVQVSTSSGAATVKGLSEKSLSGKINSAGMKLGTYTLADDVEILDSADGSALRVYPSRLAGVTFTGDMVRYYVLNGKGEISRLILDDVTGDLNLYGIVTDVTEVEGNMAAAGSYIYDIGGVAGVYSSSSSNFGISEGPCKFVMENGAVSSISNLYSVKFTSVSGNTGVGASADYTLADDVLVYELVNGDYYLSSLDRVSSDFSLTGWYDRSESSGGRIRVITARPSAD